MAGIRTRCKALECVVGGIKNFPEIQDFVDQLCRSLGKETPVSPGNYVCKTNNAGALLFMKI